MAANSPEVIATKVDGKEERACVKVTTPCNVLIEIKSSDGTPLATVEVFEHSLGGFGWGKSHDPRKAEGWIGFGSWTCALHLPDDTAEPQP